MLLKIVPVIFILEPDPELFIPDPQHWRGGLTSGRQRAGRGPGGRASSSHLCAACNHAGAQRPEHVVNNNNNND